MKDYFIINPRPTQDELDNASKNGQVVLSLFVQPEYVCDHATYQAWIDGYTNALGIQKSHRHSVQFVPSNINFADYIDHYTKVMEDRKIFDWQFIVASEECDAKEKKEK